MSDYRRLVASSLVLAVADEAFGRRGTPLGGSDLAPVLETYARDLTRRLEPKCFGSDTETAAPVAAFARVAVASWLGSSGVDGPGP